MARIRSIHPGIFTDEAFMAATPFARLLILGLCSEAFDDGIFEWKPLTLKARIFPADTVDLAALLSELEELRFIRSFDVDGKRYGAIRNFCRYQRPKAPKYLIQAPREICAFVGMTGRGDEGPMMRHADEGPMTFARDVTAAERKRRQRQRERDDFGTSGEDGGNCHGLNVTTSEMSRQMEEGGGRKEEEDRLKSYFSVTAYETQRAL